LRIAVAPGPDLGTGIVAADEGIAIGHGTVVPDADDLAEMGPQVLRQHAIAGLLALAQCHPEKAVIIELEARAEMAVAADLRLLPEDHLDILQRAISCRE